MMTIKRSAPLTKEQKESINKIVNNAGYSGISGRGVFKKLENGGFKGTSTQVKRYLNKHSTPKGRFVSNGGKRYFRNPNYKPETIPAPEPPDFVPKPTKSENPMEYLSKFQHRIEETLLRYSKGVEINTLNQHLQANMVDLLFVLSQADWAVQTQVDTRLLWLHKSLIKEERKKVYVSPRVNMAWVEIVKEEMRELDTEKIPIDAIRRLILSKRSFAIEMKNSDEKSFAAAIKRVHEYIME